MEEIKVSKKREFQHVESSVRNEFKEECAKFQEDINQLMVDLMDIINGGSQSRKDKDKIFDKVLKLIQMTHQSRLLLIEKLEISELENEFLKKKIKKLEEEKFQLNSEIYQLKKKSESFDWKISEINSLIDDNERMTNEIQIKEAENQSLKVLNSHSLIFSSKNIRNYAIFDFKNFIFQMGKELYDDILGMEEEFAKKVFKFNENILIVSRNLKNLENIILKKNSNKNHSGNTEELRRINYGLNQIKKTIFGSLNGMSKEIIKKLSEKTEEIFKNRKKGFTRNIRDYFFRSSSILLKGDMISKATQKYEGKVILKDIPKISESETETTTGKKEKGLLLSTISRKFGGGTDIVKKLEGQNYAIISIHRSNKLRRILITNRSLSFIESGNVKKTLKGKNCSFKFFS